MLLRFMVVSRSATVKAKFRKKYPNGSPTTRKATSTLSASARMVSLDDSTISRSAMITGRP